jgi:hypothetical protein
MTERKARAKANKEVSPLRRKERGPSTSLRVEITRFGGGEARAYLGAEARGFGWSMRPKEIQG